jgi:cyclopropane fatty-acyl-phospholipid synthase-like methyltransferase
MGLDGAAAQLYVRRQGDCVKQADDPHVDYKELVRIGYDRCSIGYIGTRRKRPPVALRLLTDRLHGRAAILDIGCGAGVPIAKALSKKHDVTGIDISEKQIELARLNVPDASFMCKDIMDCRFADSTFDAIIAFYSIFHLPQDQHVNLFSRVYGWLKPGGYLFATLSMDNEPPYTEDDFFGVKMYWSNLSLEEYREALQKTGFDIVTIEMLGHGYKSSDSMKPETHPLMLAQKNGSA